MLSCNLCSSSLSSKDSLLNHKSTVHGVVGRYRCGFCKKYFHHKDEYNKCRRTHTGEKPYKCRVQNCDKSFGTTSTRSAHEQSHGTERKFGCTQCSNFYKTNYDLKRHMKRVHLGGFKTECPDCGKILSSAGNLRIHRRQHTGETPYKCNKCEKQFGDYSSFKRHEKLHLSIADQSDIACKICDKTFKRHDRLWRHSQKEHVKEIKSCQLCNYTTFLTQNLKDHMQYTHEKKEKVLCQPCNKSIPKRSYTMHVRMVHEKPRAKKCNICQKGFATDSNLRTHQLFHKGTREFPCRLCAKSFFTNSSRKVHFEAIHNENKLKKSLKCKQCEFTSEKQRGLMEHNQEVHGSVPKYCCKLCKFNATSLSQLQSHKLTHIGRKQNVVKCDICQKMISSKQHLRIHQQIHKGLRQRYPCSECDKTFTTKRGHKRHYENIHKGNRSKRQYKCKQCEFITLKRRTLMQHGQEIHGAVAEYPCNICTFQATNSCDLKKHRNSHTIMPHKKVFECPLCFAKFAKNGSVERHKRSEHVETPCNKCDITLPNATEFKKHLRSNHNCNDCSFEAINLSELKKHRLSHPIDRKFLCSACPAKFGRKDHLKGHKIRHHDEKPCSKCDMKFLIIRDLKKHIRKFHSRKK